MADPLQNTNQSSIADAPTDPSIQGLMKAIGITETNGNYNDTGDGGNSLGAYQISKQNWSTWGQQYLGDSNAPLTPANQDKVAYNRISDLAKQGYQPSQIASIWNSGKPDPTGNVGVNSQGEKFDTPQYVKSVGNTYNQIMQGNSNPTITPTDSTVGGTAPTPQAPSPYGASFPASNSDNLTTGILKTVGNIPSSAWNLAKNLGNVIMHPEATIQNIGDALSGGVEDAMDATGITKALGGTVTDTVQKQKASAVWNALKTRYGSLNNIRNTVENDPTGFAMDVSTILAGGGGLIKEAGLLDQASDVADLTEGLSGADKSDMINEASKTGELGKTAQIGQGISNMGNAINPVGLATRGVSGALGLSGGGMAGIPTIMDWANSHGLPGVSLAQMATAYAAHLMGLGIMEDAVAGFFEPHVAKLIDFAALKSGSALSGLGSVVGNASPTAGLLGNVGNVASKANQ